MEFPPCGFIRTDDGNIVTKHDSEIIEQKNSDKALQLPLALSTGDCIGSRIGGKVFNELKTFGKMENKRKMRIKDKEEKATSELSVDVKTRLTLLKWINSGQFDRVEGWLVYEEKTTVG